MSSLGAGASSVAPVCFRLTANRMCSQCSQRKECHRTNERPWVSSGDLVPAPLMTKARRALERYALWRSFQGADGKPSRACVIGLTFFPLGNWRVHTGAKGGIWNSALVYLTLDFTCTLALDKHFCEDRITRESVTTAGNCASAGSLWGGGRGWGTLLSLKLINSETLPFAWC